MKAVMSMSIGSSNGVSMGTVREGHLDIFSDYMASSHFFLTFLDFIKYIISFKNFFFIYLIYLFIYGCVGSSLLRMGFL